MSTNEMPYTVKTMLVIPGFLSGTTFGTSDSFPSNWWPVNEALILPYCPWNLPTFSRAGGSRGMYCLAVRKNPI